MNNPMAPALPELSPRQEVALLARILYREGYDDHLAGHITLKVFGGFLPSSNMRWCTKMLKLKPFEEYVGDDSVRMYVGIRADEDLEALHLLPDVAQAAVVSRLHEPDHCSRSLLYL